MLSSKYLKILVIGDIGVGKTQFLSKLSQSPKINTSTIGIDIYYYKKYILWEIPSNINNKKIINQLFKDGDYVFIIWDGYLYPHKWIRLANEHHIDHILLTVTDNFPFSY